MSNKLRRFEILLLLQFNDEREVPPKWLAEAVFPTLKMNRQIEFFNYQLSETEIKDVRVNSRLSEACA